MGFAKLSAPAKIRGKWFKEDQIAEVDFDTATDLENQGLVKEYSETGFPSETAPGVSWLLKGTDLNLLTTNEQFQAAVQAEALKLAGQAFDGAIGKLEAEAREIVASTEKLDAENKQLLARAVEAEAQRDQALARILELQDAAGQADQNKPSEPPAKTAPIKKGAAGTKG